VASLSQGRTAAAQCGLFTYKSVPVIFEPPCTYIIKSSNFTVNVYYISYYLHLDVRRDLVHNIHGIVI